jgi:hypothetical protein
LPSSQVFNVSLSP